MVSFNADITNPPAIEPSSDSALGWVGYILVAGVMFVALGIASNVVAPTINSALPMDESGGGATIEVE